MCKTGDIIGFSKQKLWMHICASICINSKGVVYN